MKKKKPPKKTAGAARLRAIMLRRETKRPKAINIKVETTKDKQRKVVDWLKRYRAATRKIFNLAAMAEFIGASIEEVDDDIKVVRNSARTDDVLAVLGTPGVMPYYSLRSVFMEDMGNTCHSYVWDAARAEITKTMKARDPKIEASRLHLILQLVRRNGLFLRLPLEIPRASEKATPGRIRWDGHKMSMIFDKEIGEVEFHIDTTDPSTWGIIRNILSGEWPRSSIKLNEWEDVCHMKDGKTFRKHQIRITIGYDVPRRGRNSASRVLIVPVAPEGKPGFRIMSDMIERADLDFHAKDSGHGDWVGFEHAAASLAQFEAKRAALTIRKADCGNPRAPWGDRRGWEHNQRILSRNTRDRERFVHDVNHHWSRRIALRAENWDCGTVKLIFPGPSTEMLVGEFRWAWYDFIEKLRNKADAMGATLVVVNPEAASSASTPAKPASRKTSRRE